MSKELIETFHRLLRPINLRMRTRVNGARFRIQVSRGIGASNLRTSDPWMIDSLRRLFELEPNAPIVDIGASLGQTLLKVRSLDAHRPYIGFEPSAFCVDYLQELIAINGFRNCRIVPTALGANAGIVTLNTNNAADTSASMIDSVRGGQGRNFTQAVPLLPFDEIYRSIDAEQTKLIHIDAQGAELEVVSGMQKVLQNKRPLLSCKVLHAQSQQLLSITHHRNVRLINALHRADYWIYQIVKNADEDETVGLNRVDMFADRVWDWRTSPADCDYLFVPDERVLDVHDVYGVDNNNSRVAKFIATAA